MDINMEYINGILFVRLIGSLNKLTANNFIDTIIPIINKHGIKYMVYNFSELKSIDNYGNNVLLEGYNAIINNYGNVLVVNNRFNLEYFKEVKDELSALNILKI